MFEALEKVVLAKLNDFNTHDIIKTFVSFYELGQGSGNFYERLVNYINSHSL